ncbi:MAG: L-alanine-DL-glutamate epimerase, partial [Kiritimatiellae bacterium]|nr:L-alanine-DL-glutamate epimerase [Kiritimatiellia bacterium]
GYGAMALKPIAKTLSVSLAVAAAAKRRGVPCFCADLTVSPPMVEWNKAVAARLDAFPGIRGIGLVETNGEQNYVNWERMRLSLSRPDAAWTRARGGVFELDADYWDAAGALF